MATNKQQDQKKDLIVIDFDQTIFYNPTNNFSVAIPLDDVLNAHLFFSEFMYQTGNLIPNNTEFILITGRHCDQKEVISHMLELKGYRIDHAYFNQMDRKTVIEESSFLIKYWIGKVELINKLMLSDKYKSIIVLEDDPLICSMLEKINIRVFKAQITKHDYTQTLSITFNSPQKRFMSELQNLLELHKYQDDHLTEIT